MKREIIRIDEDRCNGCGDCIPNCPEGALKIIDGKARLIAEMQCDGLGACLGHCPEGAMLIEEREAEAYDERRVIELIIPQGEATLRAHLEHLRDHDQNAELKEAHEVLREHGIALELEPKPEPKPEPKSEPKTAPGHDRLRVAQGPAPMTAGGGGGCPGSRAMSFGPAQPAAPQDAADGPQRTSQLAQWPIQLHLVSPMAPYFQGSDVLLAADCVPFTIPDFHERYLSGRKLAIACPKLDDGQEVYLEKLIAMIDHSGINTMTVMTMEVPCCGGLVRLAAEAASRAQRKVPVRTIVCGIRGDILRDEWLASAGQQAV